MRGKAMRGRGLQCGLHLAWHSATRPVALLAMALCGALAACAGAEPEGPPSSPPSLTWNSVLQPGAVAVELVDPSAYYRVVGAALVDPQGRRYEADTLDRQVFRDTSPGAVRPSIGVGVGGGSGGFGTGVGVSFPVFSGGPQGYSVSRTRMRFVLKDEAYYRETAERWEVVVHLSALGGATYTAAIPAPVPGSE